jgi:hypothetical protein
VGAGAAMLVGCGTMLLGGMISVALDMVKKRPHKVPVEFETILQSIGAQVKVTVGTHPTLANIYCSHLMSGSVSGMAIDTC